MFYSALLRGFYNTEDHGPREISVVDPAWIRPMVDVYLQPGESAWVGGEYVTNTDDEPMTINVPDIDAIPDMVTVNNLSCLIPPDAVEITRELRDQLLAGEATGRFIAPDEHGFPMLTDPPLPSDDELAAIERVWRDGRLAASDGVVARHRDEAEVGGATTLTPAQYAELQAYRQALRKWPQGEQFPLEDHRPVAPTWLVDGEVLL